jgi:hypothetical protein
MEGLLIHRELANPARKEAITVAEVSLDHCRIGEKDAGEALTANVCSSQLRFFG